MVLSIYSEIDALSAGAIELEMLKIYSECIHIFYCVHERVRSTLSQECSLGTEEKVYVISQVIIMKDRKQKSFFLTGN